MADSEALALWGGAPSGREHRAESAGEGTLLGAPVRHGTLSGRAS